MAAENLSTPSNSNGNDGMIMAQGRELIEETGEILNFTYYYSENRSEGEIEPHELKPIAQQTIDSALQVPFLQRLNGRLVAENGELIKTHLEFRLPEETVSLQASQTPQGREISISAKDGFISLSDGLVPMVDLKKQDGEILQSTAQAVSEVGGFLAGIDERVGDVEPETPLIEKIVVNVERYHKP